MSTIKSDRKKILAISGSTRNHSTNETILKTIATSFNEAIEVHIFKGLSELPHFNPDVEDAPENVVKFRNAVQEAAGVIICTPEYIFSLPGSLKNAIEWTVSTTVFSDKPLAIIVASGLGEKTFESLQLIMKTVGAKFENDSTVLIQGARAKVNAQGKFDEATWREIENVVKSLIRNL